LVGFNMRQTRYNKSFYQFLEFLEQSQWWSLDEFQSYQNEQLTRVIHHAYHSVPYYRRVMDERKLKPSDIRLTADLIKLPILTKQMVRELGSELVSTEVLPRRRIHGHTGGTTGTSLQLYSDENTQPHQWAVWWRHRRRFGLNIDDEFIVFAGRSVIPLNSIDPPFWRRNLPMHQTYVSIHHMTRQNMPALLEYLQKRNVKYYSGYPSAVYLVAKYMIDNNVRLQSPPLEGNVSNISRIICTGFWNDAMPLIRYDIGDIATLPTQNVVCSCGRKSQIVEKIDGRIESYIITPDGRQAGRLDFIFKDSKYIEEAQFIQHEISTVTIKIVRSKGYSSTHEKELLADLRTYLGSDIRIEIEYVSDILRTSNGKFRQIVSTVFNDQNNL